MTTTANAVVDGPALSLPSREQTLVRTGDCLVLLPQLPAGCISVAVTSPPYNIGMEYASYSDRLDRHQYLDWLWRVGEELRRVLADDGSLFMNVGSIPSDPWVAHDVAEVFRRYGEWSAEVHTRLCRMGFDFIWAGGDIAYKTAPFFSPQVFREIILPALRPAAEAITLPWIYHSDGNLIPILDDLLSLGMNALHPFETGAMDMAAVKKRYGKRLCVVGNLDMDLLIRGTPEQNAAETKRLLREFAPGGGYIFSSSNTLSYGVRAENVLAVSRVIKGQESKGIS